MDDKPIKGLCISFETGQTEHGPGFRVVRAVATADPSGVVTVQSDTLAEGLRLPAPANDPVTFKR